MTDTSGHGVTLSTYCKHDAASGTISWRAGSYCPSCCACPEGAEVSIRVEVEPTP